MKFFEWVLVQYVKRSRRFFGPIWDKFDEETGVVHRCPNCREVVDEKWKICENCMYPLPLFCKRQKR